MSADEDSDDDAATVIGRTDTVREAMARPGVESPTRKFDVRALSNPTRAMPAGYGMSRAGELERVSPPPRPSSRSAPPRPAAGRPAPGRPGVPSVVDDPTSESEMTLIEAIDAELESITAELSIPEGTDPDMLDGLPSDTADRTLGVSGDAASSEMTVRMSVPDLPSDLLDAVSEPGTQIQPPRAPAPPSIAELRPPRGVPSAALSLSSMPTPQRPVRTGPMDFVAPLPARPEIAAAGPSPAPWAAPLAVAAADVASAERPVGPRPAWVGRYIAACAVVSVLGAVVLVYLKLHRFW